MRTRTVAAALLVAALAGCAADDYFEQGRAWEARDASAAAEYYRLCLLEDPAHPGARDRLTSFDFYGALLERARGHEDRGEWREALRAYDRVAEVSFVLKGMGGPAPGIDLAARRDQVARSAAAARFEDGRRAQAQGDHAAATRAFRESLALDPTNVEAGVAYREAHAQAVRRVGLTPFETDAAGDAQLARDLGEAVEAGIARRRPELLELVTRTKLEQVLTEHDLVATGLVDPASAARMGKLLGIDLVVVGRVAAVERVDSGWQEEAGQQTVERKKDGGGTEQVSAAWTVKRRTTKAIVRLSLQAIDVEDGAVLVAEQITREKEATAHFARKTSGDDAALPVDVASLCRASDAAPATPDDLVKAAIAEAADVAAATLVERLR